MRSRALNVVAAVNVVKAVVVSAVSVVKAAVASVANVVKAVVVMVVVSAANVVKAVRRVVTGEGGGVLTQHLRAVHRQLAQRFGDRQAGADGGGDMVDGIEEVSEVHSTSGQYDLLGKFYLAPDQDIGLFVVERLQTVPCVKDTYTLQTFNAFTAAQG